MQYLLCHPPLFFVFLDVDCKKGDVTASEYVCLVVVPCVLHNKIIKGNIAIYKDLNLEFVTKNSSCYELAAKNVNENNRQ